MSCTLKSVFEDKFKATLTTRVALPELQKSEISSWVYQNNNMMKDYGFDKEVFKIEYNTRQLGGNRGSITDYVLKYDEKANEEWEAYQYHIDSEEAKQQIQEQIILNQGFQFAPNEHLESSEQTFDPVDTINMVDSPVNFTEWKNNRKLLKENLEKQATQYRKHNNDKRKLKLVNKAIAEIDKQLQKFNEDDASIVHEVLIQEIDTLNTLLNSITTNPIDASVILESNRIKERINELSIYFNGIDLINNNSEVNDSLKELLENTFEKSKVDNIKIEISNLYRQYNGSLFNIIESVFANDSLLIEHKRNMTPEKFKEFYDKTLQLIKDKEVYIGNNGSIFKVGGQDFLGAASVDSVLSDLLFSGRENYYNQEVGQTQILVQKFSDAWKLVKDKVDINKNFITTQLYQKDALGVRTNKLITPFKTAFYKLHKDINSIKSSFYSNKNAQSYKTWMNMLKNNTDFIQPYKLKFYYDLYKDNPVFKDYFKFSVQEMIAYEQELKNKLGNTLYQIELEKQQEKIKNYLHEQENNLFASPSYAYSKNPFTFINNFYSENYNKPDANTFEYLEPSYTQYLPKLDKTSYFNPEDYFNPELKKIESEEFGEDLMEVYKNGYQLLTDYVNPSLQSEGVNLSATELMNQVDILDREAIKNLSFFKKIPLQFKNLWNSILENYTIGKTIESDDKKSFKTKYNSYGKNKTQVLKQLYNSKTEKELSDLLKKEGIDTNNTINGIKINKKQMINSLTQLQLNKVSSTNLFSSITESTEIVRNMNARKNTMNMFDLFSDYTRNKDKQNEKEYEYLQNWGRLNLQKEKYLSNNEDLKFMHKSITKTYMTFDRNIQKMLANEKNNINFQYNFKLGEDTYKKQNDEYYKNDEKISKEQIDAKYNEYTEELLDKLGVEYTITSFANGLLAGIYKSAMRTFAPARYFLNRFAGLNQNMSAAAAKEFGFDMKQLLVSRRFLRGDILKKIINYGAVRKLLGFQESEKQKNMKTLLSLAESLRILETSMETVKQDGEFGSKGLLQKIDMALNNTAVNYPEWKNQMESLLSVLQNVEIETINKDANGQVIKKQLFDGKNFIYVPGTLQLKEEFRTENNVENWEKFKEDKDGSSPQNLIFAMAKQAKRKTQGNYASEDKIPILGSELGKLGSVFTRFLYENTNRQYGAKKSDLTSGQLDVKGNKLILMQHAPTFLTHIMFGNGWVNTLGGMVIGTSVVSAGAFASTAVIVPALILGSVVIANRKIIKMNHLTKDEMKLALNYAKETALRSINIMPNYFQLSLIPEDKINSLRYIPSGMTEKERNIISASAEELAQKMGLFLGSAISSLILAGIYSMLASGGDDEEKKNRMKQLEGKLNTIINLKNSLYSDIEKYTNPLAFKDAASTLIYFRMIERNWGKMNKAIDSYAIDKIQEGELTLELTKALGFLVGLPKAVTESTDPGSLINTDRIYSKGDWFDELIDDKTKPAELNYKEITADLREPIRNKLKNQIRDSYNDAGKEISEDAISKLASAWLRENGYMKGRNDSYEDLYKKSDSWESAENKINEINSGNVHYLQKAKREQEESNSGEEESSGSESSGESASGVQ